MKLSLSRFLRWGTKDPETSAAGLAQKGSKPAGAQSARPRSPGEQREGGATVAWLDAEGRLQRHWSLIRNLGDGAMSVQVARAVETNTRIWLLTQDGGDVPAVVRYCNSVEQGCHVGFEPVPNANDKSQEERRFGDVRMSWIDREQRCAASWVKISNAADGILSVDSPDEIPSPAIVSLTGSEYCSLGIARFYRKEGDRCTFEVETITDAVKILSSVA